MKISAKEADEVEYWLLLCQSSRGYPETHDLLKKIVVSGKYALRSFQLQRQPSSLAEFPHPAASEG
jgi:hypothetical protein